MFFVFSQKTRFFMKIIFTPYIKHFQTLCNWILTYISMPIRYILAANLVLEINDPIKTKSTVSSQSATPNGILTIIIIGMSKENTHPKSRRAIWIFHNRLNQNKIILTGTVTGRMNC